MDWHRHLLWLALPLIAVGCLLIVIVDPGGGEHIAVGYLIGTVFSHATLTSAWTAFGPLPLVLRLPLAILWLAASVTCIALNVWVHGESAEIPVILGACALGQYASLQLPFWALALGMGIRLRHQGVDGLPSNPREYQYGIRQLMIFTVIVAIILGAGRLIVTLLGPQLSSAVTDSDLPIFIFLLAASIIMTLPLLLAGLLPKYAWQAVLVVLLLIGIATTCELPLINTVARGGGPDFLHLVFINGFTSAWILAVVLVARISGYRLSGRGAIGNLPMAG